MSGKKGSEPCPCKVSTSGQVYRHHSPPSPEGTTTKKWTDDDLYDAYLRGCEDACIPEPLDKGTFLASWEDVQDAQ